MGSDRWIEQTAEGAVVVRSADGRHADLAANEVRLDLDETNVFWSPLGDAVLLYNPEQDGDEHWLLRIKQGVLSPHRVRLGGVPASSPWSPDGTVLLCESEAGLHVVQIDGGTSFEIAAPPGEFFSDAVWDQRGSRVAVRWTGGIVSVWSMKDAKRVGGDHHTSERDPVLSPDGTRLLLFPGWRKAEVHDVEGKKPIVKLPDLGDMVTAAGFSPSGDRVCLGCGQGAVGVIPLDDPARFVALHGHSEMVWSVAWSPDGRRVASVAKDGSVAVWELTWPDARAKLLRSPDFLRPSERSLLLGEASEVAQDRMMRAR
jgi:WD40 repeat protein